MGELVGEGAEVQVLVDSCRVQESQVQNVGADGWSAVSAGEIARGSSGEIVGAGVVLRRNGDVEVERLVEGRHLVVVTCSSSELHRRSEVDAKISLEVVSHG